MTAPTVRKLGQFDVTQAAKVRRLAGTIRRSTAAKPAEPPQATVTAANATTPPTCTVLFDGGDPADLRYLASYTPAAGDVVEVVWRSGSPFIVGVLA